MPVIIPVQSNVNLLSETGGIAEEGKITALIVPKEEVKKLKNEYYEDSI